MIEIVVGLVLLVFLVIPCLGLLLWWCVCTEINRHRFRKTLSPEYDRVISLYLNTPFWRVCTYAEPEHKD